MREQTGHVLEFTDAAMAVAWIAALERAAISDQWEHFWTDIAKNGSTKNPVTGRWMWVRRRTHKQELTHVPGWIKRHYADQRREKAVAKALEKFEALGSDVISIPTPTEIVPQGFAELVRVTVQAISDLDIVEVYHRKMAALEQFFKNKKQRHEVITACRWCELRLGQLLGQPEHGGDRKSENFKSSANDLISPNERHQFRSMADHQEIFERCIKGGRTSRASILSAIKASHANGNGKKPLDAEDISQKVISFLKRELKGASAEDTGIVLAAICAAFGVDFENYFKVKENSCSQTGFSVSSL